MKLIATFLCSLILGAAVAAQDVPAAPAAAVAQDWVAQSLKKHTWELGVVAGGGTGLGKSDGTQFAFGGGRGGWILTGDHLPGILRGNFEWAVDVLPLFAVLPPASGVYGASVRPAIWQWNFTSWNKYAPYVAIVGGTVFTTSNVPPGNTAAVNFTEGLAFGTYMFVKPRRAFSAEATFGHLSNASIGRHNPGYNATFIFTLGYSWFKGGR
jgi:lipid A 3-O-deacylase